ncbi:sialic acid-binding Ig-like lectin 15 [Trematomus bernacchii]|uniref:sialic acid-binding Ig-like lectin 15 n=1 Tax=Trematomus bernacchii TaxID=40690 RepID=UPI00146D9248|nr:sialic acid-binding Ig-like lectin 15 [Trematomus bernacchii]
MLVPVMNPQRIKKVCCCLILRLNLEREERKPSNLNSQIRKSCETKRFLSVSILLALVSLVSSSSLYGGLVPVPGVLDFPVPPSYGPAPPKILSLWAEGSELSGFTALCRVQGSPPPDVQWLGTEGSMLEGSMLEGSMLEGSHPLAQGSRERFHTVSQLRDVSPGQQYTCSASNPLGKDQAVLYVLPPRPHVGGASTPLLLLLSLPLGAKVLLLLLLGGVWAVHGVRCWRK